jgi:hypothetical protein
VLRRVGGYFVGGLVAVSTAIVALLLNANLHPLVKNIDDVVGRELGQTIKVSGPVGLDLAVDGLWIVLNDVEINTDQPLEASVKPLAGSLGRIRVLVRALPLLQRQIRLGEVEFTQANLTFVPSRPFGLSDNPLRRTFELGNQTFALGGIHTVRTEDSHFVFMDGGEVVFEMQLGSAKASPADMGLAIEAEGQVRGQDVYFEGRTGPLLAAMSGHRIHIDGAFRSGTAELKIAGTVGEFASLGVNLIADGSASHLNDVALLFGLQDVQNEVSTSAAATIRGNRDHLVIKDIRAAFGRGDLSGQLEISQGQALVVNGRFHSDVLDLDVFKGASLSRPPTRIFSDAPIATDWLRSGQMDVSYNADRVILANALLEEGRVQIFLGGGVLSINPLQAVFLDGSFDSLLIVDARSFPYFRAETNLRNFDLGNFLSNVNVTGDFEAHLDFGLRIEGEGDSLATMLGNAKGQSNLLMGPGRLPERAVQMIGGDLASELRPVSYSSNENGDSSVKLNCAVSRFDIERGVAKSRAFLVQTESTITTGRGEVNLGTESINLRLAPRPKNPAFLENAADLRVGGSFMRPVFDVQRDKISRGIAGSLGRFALVREADVLLLPLLESEASDYNACISAFSGALEENRGRTSIYDDFDDVKNFDFKRAGRGK